MDEKDVWRAAQAVLKLHGDDALAYARTRAEQFAAQGADDGAAAWRRIAAAIEELERTEPGGSLH